MSTTIPPNGSMTSNLVQRRVTVPRSETISPDGPINSAEWILIHERVREAILTIWSAYYPTKDQQQESLDRYRSLSMTALGIRPIRLSHQREANAIFDDIYRSRLLEIVLELSTMIFMVIDRTTEELATALASLIFAGVPPRSKLLDAMQSIDAIRNHTINTLYSDVSSPKELSELLMTNPWLLTLLIARHAGAFSGETMASIVGTTP